MKKIFVLFALLSGCASTAPDLVVLGGHIVTGEAEGTMREAMAVRGGRIVAVGNTQEISRMAGPSTKVIELGGRMVLPGLYEPHVHPQMIRLAYLQDHEYQQLRSIAEIQEWVRKKARETHPGEWIRIPRNEITRLKEHRHPTVAELDAACTSHPVVFDATRRYVFNTRGLREMGINDDTKSLMPAKLDKTPDDALLGTQAQNGVTRPIVGGQIIRGADGKPQYLVATSDEIIGKFAPHATWTAADEKAFLLKLHATYNEAGITTIFERGAPVIDYRQYQELNREGLLTVRVRFTMIQDFKSAADVETFVKKENLHPNEGDDWLSLNALKILADGGIHFGNTRLSEPYGSKRIKAYVQDDPDFRGDQFYTEDQMRDVFGAAARLHWQMVVHVTGDGALDSVLKAFESVNKITPLQDRRFMLIHAYFPTPELAARTAALGMAVDTHPGHYYLDAPFIHDVYGPAWADRFIGVGTWARAGVPIVLSSDHMVGLDRDHAMNPYNPFRAVYAAVSRRTDTGEVFGPTQKLSRFEALRSVTAVPALMSFKEKDSGTLEAGKFADFVVIDRDFFTCPEEEILGIKVLRTVVAGKTVYERP